MNLSSSYETSPLPPYGDAATRQPAELVGDDREQVTNVTPSREYVNASTTERLSLTGWTVARPGADNHKAFKSRGF